MKESFLLLSLICYSMVCMEPQQNVVASDVSHTKLVQEYRIALERAEWDPSAATFHALQILGHMLAKQGITSSQVASN